MHPVRCRTLKKQQARLQQKHGANTMPSKACKHAINRVESTTEQRVILRRPQLLHTAYQPQIFLSTQPSLYVLLATRRLISRARELAPGSEPTYEGPTMSTSSTPKQTAPLLDTPNMTRSSWKLCLLLAQQVPLSRPRLGLAAGQLSANPQYCFSHCNYLAAHTLTYTAQNCTLRRNI